MSIFKKVILYKIRHSPSRNFYENIAKPVTEDFFKGLEEGFKNKDESQSKKNNEQKS